MTYKNQCKKVEKLLLQTLSILIFWYAV